FLGHFLELAGGDHAARTLRGGDFGHYGQHDARVLAHHGKPVDTADDAALRDRHLVVLPALHERIGELLFDRARAVFGLEYVVACGELGVLGTGDVACNPNQATQITHLEREMTLPTRTALSFEDDLLDRIAGEVGQPTVVVDLLSDESRVFATHLRLVLDGVVHVDLVAVAFDPRAKRRVHVLHRIEVARRDHDEVGRHGFGL